MAVMTIRWMVYVMIVGTVHVAMTPPVTIIIDKADRYEVSSAKRSGRGRVRACEDEHRLVVIVDRRGVKLMLSYF